LGRGPCCGSNDVTASSIDVVVQLSRKDGRRGVEQVWVPGKSGQAIGSDLKHM